VQGGGVELQRGLANHDEGGSGLGAAPGAPQCTGRGPEVGAGEGEGPAGARGGPPVEMAQEVVVGAEERGVEPVLVAGVAGEEGTPTAGLLRVQQADADLVVLVVSIHIEALGEFAGLLEHRPWGAAGGREGVAVSQDTEMAPVAGHDRVRAESK
jgi:hypothetical protein